MLSLAIAGKTELKRPRQPLISEFRADRVCQHLHHAQVEPQTQPEPEDDATLLRMNRTLEFCPDLSATSPHLPAMPCSQ